ncbi:MAG: transcription antitermination factor NusB [Acidimicrobiales bacterium]
MTPTGRAGRAVRATPPRPPVRGQKVRPATARSLALGALVRLDGEGARANVVVPELLSASTLVERDRAFVTELVYGTVRMRRACDWLVDRHLRRSVESEVRAALRLGAYQLAFLGTPPHAGVSATVSEVTGPARGLVNAVLRRVADDVTAGVAWPSEGVRLSYPDWIVDLVSAAIGRAEALAALAQMNVAASVTVRPDGYVQDLASQWVGEAVGAVGLASTPLVGGVGVADGVGVFGVAGGVSAVGLAGERVADLCAAPGGKATYLARGHESSGAGDSRPALVVAGDRDRQRAAMMTGNITRLELDNVATVVCDATRPPFPSGSFDRVLVDAPCSGLGVLRRRPDARWRIQPADVARLAGLQRRLLAQALALVRPGGLVAYSVCTLTTAETVEIDQWLADTAPSAAAIDPPVGSAWERIGRGARLLPQTVGTDGMYLLMLRGCGG